MPVIFLGIGFGIIFLMVYPFFSVGEAVSNLLFTSADTDAEGLGNVTFVEPNQEELNKITEELVNKEDNSIDIQNIVWPKTGDQYGALKCEKIGLDTAVFWGDDSELLRQGPGAHRSSDLPGMGGPMLIAGHNTMEFTCLQHIEKGDLITFTVAYGKYEYEVTDIKVLEHNDPTAYDMERDEEELILYTCYPFTELGATNERCFVYAKRVSGPDVVRKEVADIG